MAQTKSHLPIIPILSFVVFFLTGTLFLQNGRNTSTHTEPLADPQIISQLLQHKDIPEPVEEHYAQFHGTMVNPPKLASLKQVSRVLGVASPSDKHIGVDLSQQKLFAYEGNRKVFEFPVSTGKWGRTPTGTFRIWVKLKSVLMSGGAGADYYYLPNVPWVMFFSNAEVSASRGFSLHGTYWHNNFGHPMSHGCVNMRTEDAALIFDWASPVVTTNPKTWGTYATADNPGTEIEIYGEPPLE